MTRDKGLVERGQRLRLSIRRWSPFLVIIIVIATSGIRHIVFHESLIWHEKKGNNSYNISNNNNQTNLCQDIGRLWVA